MSSVKNGDLFAPATGGSAIRHYRGILTAAVNRKGVLDVDTVRGCAAGMRAHPDGGCYGACYALKIAHRHGIDFRISVSRVPGLRSWRDVFCTVRDHWAPWYRIGTFGDPCHDWSNTIMVCEMLQATGKRPVIITKHWVAMTDDELEKFAAVRAVFNTSTSGLDSDPELAHRVRQLQRIRNCGMSSMNRVVTCNFGHTAWAESARKKQDYLLSIRPVIENPLRATPEHPRVQSGDIIVQRVEEAVGGGKWVSLRDPGAYLGTCRNCPDQCGGGEP